MATQGDTFVKPQGRSFVGPDFTGSPTSREAGGRGRHRSTKRTKVTRNRRSRRAAHRRRGRSRR